MGIGKTDNNFSEKGFDFCPATLVTVRKGLHIVKTEFNLAKRSLNFVLQRYPQREKDFLKRTPFYYM